METAQPAAEKEAGTQPSAAYARKAQLPLDARRAPVALDLAALSMRALEPVAIVASAMIVNFLMFDRIPDASDPFYLRAALLAAVFYAGLAEATGTYDADVRFAMRAGVARVLTAWFATAMFVLTVGFILKVSEDYSRLWAFTWFVSGGAALASVRIAGTGWIRNKKREGYFDLRVAVFGAGEQGSRLVRYITQDDRLTIRLVGFFDDRARNRLRGRHADLDIMGNLDDLITLIRKGDIDQVIIALPWSAENRLQEVVAALAVTPVRIRLAPDLASFAFAQRPIVMLGDLPVMTLFERPISGLDRIIKRIEDLLILLLIAPVAIPLLALTALAVRLDSPGPIFFRQEREGFNNKRFHIWKFRSMRVEKLEYDAITQATKDDARITRFGKFMRRTSLDELPQLINVLTGEMSMIGPRPHAPSTRAGGRLFGDVVASYAARHNVKPGITGWAQVRGWRGPTDTEEKLLRRLEHDLHYIENWSLGFDLYILLRTVWAVLFPRNAY